ncbi:MAG: hypothetical protein R3C53_22135 [Pirellulaceae bacterium]
MRKFFGLLVLSAGVFTIGCDTVADDRADAVRDVTQQKADQIRDAHDEAADDLRDAAGKDWTGAAENDQVENAADKIESAGENAADNVEASGERKADRIEEIEDRDN